MAFGSIFNVQKSEFIGNKASEYGDDLVGVPVDIILNMCGKSF
jgi:hypothetical protein